jgi:hypothetical protein
VFSRAANLNELLLQGFEILRKLQHNFNEAKDEIHRPCRAMHRLQHMAFEKPNKTRSNVGAKSRKVFAEHYIERYERYERICRAFRSC